MAIAVRSYTTLALVGPQDASATPGPVITSPSGLAVGDYLLIGVFYGQGLGNAVVDVPSGFTELTTNGSTANRLLVTYGLAITDTTVLSSVTSGITLRATVSATRVSAIAAALTGVSIFSSAGNLTYNSAAATSVTFTAPTTGDALFYFVATNSSSPSTFPVHTSVGGTKVVQATAPSAASGSVADSQISLMIGGTGATYAASVANNMSVGVGFSAASTNIAPVSAFTYTTSLLTVTVNGSTSSDSDGTISTYAWQYGDGNTSTGVTPAAHTYSTAGTYTVSLTVTDNSGSSTATNHSVTVSAATTTPPTRIGYTVTNPGASTTAITLDPSVVTSGSGISTGNWMIATVTTTSTTTVVTPPAGWSTLLGYHVVGTLAYAIFGMIRGSGDTSYIFTLDAAGDTSAASLMWGANADTNLSNWIVGANTNRSVNPHNTAASIMTVSDHSLVLGISVERTSVIESAITSVTGANEWFFMAQAGTQLETIDVSYVADKTPAGATTVMDWTYPNTQAINGMAVQIAIPPGVASTQISVGYPGIIRVGSSNYAGKLFYWDGNTAHDFTTAPVMVFAPVTVTQFLAHTPWFGAHRGFSYSYPEETLYSYRGATDWKIKAIEISVQKSSSGTFWCFHDATTDRTTGVSGTIASMTDAQIAVLTNLSSTAAGNTSQPARPVAKLVDVLNLYASTHVIIIEDKTYANTTAMLNLMDSYGTSGRPATEIFIWKVDAGSSKVNYFDPAAVRGYHRWAYIFDSSMASSFSALVVSGKADMIGMDFNSSDAVLTPAIAACIANGVMPTGHIVNSVIQRDRLLGLGMKGIMISNKDVVPPWYNIW